MRITLVISSLSAGGAERVMSIMANYWTEKGRGVTIITLDDSEDFYHLKPEVKRIKLGLMKDSTGLFSAMYNNINRITKLSRAIKSTQPDVVISFVDIVNIYTILSCFWTKNPVIISERTDPSMHKIGVSYGIIRKWVYRLSASLVVQNKNVFSWAEQIMPSNKIKIIANPVIVHYQLEEKHSKSIIKSKQDVFNIVSMGRIIESKGYDILIKAIALTNNPKIQLKIIGDGNYKEQLERLVNELELDARVTFAGQLSEPHQVLSKADVFVLASRYEGFPNALLEAMAMGMPVISTDCPSGPSEIIRDGYNGILVPVDDVQAIKMAIIRLLENPLERECLAVNAREVVRKYNLNKIMNQWNEIIDKVI